MARTDVGPDPDDDSTQLSGSGSDPVLTAPDYVALRAKAAQDEAEPDPVPELGRQGRGADHDEGDEGVARAGSSTNAYALRLLHSRPASAPDLSRYPAAVEHGPDGPVFVPPLGQVVVFNVHASPEVLPGRPYLKTVKGKVTAVDTVTGVVTVRDVDRKHECCLRLTTHDPAHVRWPGRRIWEAQNELTGRALALLESTDPEDAAEALRLLQQAKGMGDRVESAGVEAVAKRKVGRPRRQRTAEELEHQRLHEERRARGEVKRGRPRGSKNRPRAVVDAEKAQRRAERRSREGSQ